MNDDIFGAEFTQVQQPSTVIPTQSIQNQQHPKVFRSEVMQEYQNLRSSIFMDSVLVATIGFSIVWFFGTYKDAYSYAIGSGLGLCYSLLLGKFVERIGTSKENKAVDGLRFAPVVVLVGLYSKNKTDISIILELIGFISSYQLAGFLQIFNTDAYGERTEETE
jgi:hypothetical protein